MKDFLSIDKISYTVYTTKSLKIGKNSFNSTISEEKNMCYAAICGENGEVQFFGGIPKEFCEEKTASTKITKVAVTFIEPATRAFHAPMKKEGAMNDDFWGSLSRKSSRRNGYWRSHCAKKPTLADKRRTVIYH